MFKVQIYKMVKKIIDSLIKQSYVPLMNNYHS